MVVYDMCLVVLFQGMVFHQKALMEARQQRLKRVIGAEQAVDYREGQK